MTTPSAPFMQRRFLTVVLAVLIAAAAAALRIGLLDAPPEFDELYHLLAARGWLETGDPVILDGEYRRGKIYTWAVVQLFSLSGTADLETGRLLSVAAGCLLPVLVFLWLLRVASPAVALSAAAFAVAWPQGLIEAQLLRFYSVQVLVFFLGAVALYLIATQRGTRRWLWLILLVPSWLLAFRLQITSVIGMGAALAWGLGLLLWHRVPGWRGRFLWCAAALGAAALGLAVAAQTGLLEKAWAFYRWSPAHNAHLRDYPGFYFANLRKYHAVLWYATPVLALLALRLNPRLTSFCLAIFASLFLTLSFGGMKAFRYFSYAMPFLVTIWALGLVSAASWAGQALSRKHAGWRPWATGAAAALLVIGVLATTSFLPRSLTVARGDGIMDRGDWRNAAAVVGDWRDAPFIATTHELNMLAYVGPYDLLISPVRGTDFKRLRELDNDPRTGRPILGTPESFTAMLACKRAGLVVATRNWWRPEVQNMFAAAGLEWDTRVGDNVIAIRWFDPENHPPRCGDFPV